LSLRKLLIFMFDEYYPLMANDRLAGRREMISSGRFPMARIFCRFSSDTAADPILSLPDIRVGKWSSLDIELLPG
jgi:hypothetical protein